MKIGLLEKGQLIGSWSSAAILRITKGVKKCFKKMYFHNQLLSKNQEIVERHPTILMGYLEFGTFLCFFIILRLGKCHQIFNYSFRLSGIPTLFWADFFGNTLFERFWIIKYFIKLLSYPLAWLTFSYAID